MKSGRPSYTWTSCLSRVLGWSNVEGSALAISCGMNCTFSPDRAFGSSITRRASGCVSGLFLHQTIIPELVIVRPPRGAPSRRVFKDGLKASNTWFDRNHSFALLTTGRNQLEATPVLYKPCLDGCSGATRRLGGRHGLDRVHRRIRATALAG
jgi:hypothetical protein